MTITRSRTLLNDEVVFIPFNIAKIKDWCTPLHLHIINKNIESLTGTMVILVLGHVHVVGKSFHSILSCLFVREGKPIYYHEGFCSSTVCANSPVLCPPQPGSSSTMIDSPHRFWDLCG